MNTKLNSSCITTWDEAFSIGHEKIDEEHKEIHRQIILQMNSFIKQLPSLKIVEFEKKLIEYMDIWLINHILYEDRKIVKFIDS